MKTPHLLRVLSGAPRDAYQPLVDAIAADGGRCGWLRWQPLQALEPLGDELPAAGVLRDVTVGAEGNVARKRRQGPPVLRDVLREYFRGCRLVLIEGDLADVLSITAGDGDALFVVHGDNETHTLNAGDLAARLRRPHPF